jgi:hypothetical protein
MADPGHRGNEQARPQCGRRRLRPDRGEGDSLAPPWLLATILSFFLVGVIVALVGTLATLALLMNAVRRADTSD